MNGDLSKLARWLTFSVVFSLVPLGVALLSFLTFSRPLSVNAIIGHGELLLVGTTIGGAALGELIPPKTNKWLLRKLICGGATFVLVMASGMWFAAVTLGAGIVNPSVVSWGSAGLWLFTILSSGGCIALSEV